MSAGASSSPSSPDQARNLGTQVVQDSAIPSFVPPSSRSSSRADIPPSLRPGFRAADSDDDNDRTTSSSIRLVPSSSRTTTTTSTATPPPRRRQTSFQAAGWGQEATTGSITEIRLLDGQNTPQNVAVYGFGLGALFGAGLVLATMVDTSVPQLCFFLAALGVFHSMEYISTALFNPTKLTLDSYLLNHSPEYTLATVSGITEFLIERYFFPQYKYWGYLNMVGLVLVIIGQVARSWAMFSCKSNFSHHIEYYREEHHVLVTHGIYSVLRHPSYFGFYYWAVGSQLMMMNPICLLGFTVVLFKFFSERIQYEEKLLVRFFGQDYIRYQKRTYTGIPFIP